MSAVSYESFAKQVEILLGLTSDKIKGLSKKDAIKLLEFSLKFPFEHEEVAKNLTKPEHKDIIEHITQVLVAKNNAVITFISENGEEIQQEHKKKAEEVKVDVKVEEEKEKMEPQIKVVEDILGKKIEGCGNNCENCSCKEEK